MFAKCSVFFFFLFPLLAVVFGAITSNYTANSYLSVWPPGCDVVAAQQCEYDQLKCTLFTGPADDPATVCACGEIFYGQCLRYAGCETAQQVGALTLHQIYMKVCVDTIIKYDCPDVMMCSINCASEGSVDRSKSKIIPFNNYGQYYLRVRICKDRINQQRYDRYATVQQGVCKTLADFDTCSRWIPPNTFVPVALPVDATYVEVDSCHVDLSKPIGDPDRYYCDPRIPVQRIFGNSVIFPSAFNIPITSASICNPNNDKCLGSFCDSTFEPPLCSPKSYKCVQHSGKSYYDTPFS